MKCYLCKRLLVSVQMVRCFIGGDFRNVCPTCWEKVRAEKRKLKGED